MGDVKHEPIAPAQTRRQPDAASQKPPVPMSCPPHGRVPLVFHDSGFGHHRAWGQFRYTILERSTELNSLIEATLTTLPGLVTPSGVEERRSCGRSLEWGESRP